MPTTANRPPPAAATDLSNEVSADGVPDSEAARRVPRESFTERFARILTNTRTVAGSHPRRERGFLIVVRGTAQLQQLQALCLKSEFTTISCLTARYRVRPGPAIGTIVVALAADLQKMRSGDWDPKDASGDLLPQPGPVPSQTNWDTLISLPSLDSLTEAGSPDRTQEGELGPNSMARFLGGLRPHEALAVGTRLVVFAEIDPISSNPSEWTSVIETILPLLPKRLGIVVSGAPTDLRRPRRISASDPHFALVSATEVPTSAEPGDPTYHYLDSPLSGDQPADRDVLEVNRFADGLARLVLHRDTKPLTIGVHGPWGSGKSSFMQLIKQGLVRHAPTNEENGLRIGLDRIEERLDDYQPENWGNHPGSEPVADYLVDADNRRRQLLKRMEKAARKDVVTVDFNAWQYDSETQIWAGLASEITRALESAMPWYRRLTLPIRYAVGRRTSEVVISLLVPVAVVVLALVVLSRIALAEAAGTAILGDIGIFSTALPGGVLVLVVLAWRTAVVAVPVSRRILKDARGPDYSSQTGLQSQVIDDLAFVTEQLQPPHLSRPHLPKLRNRGAVVISSWPLPKARTPPPRVVVFIDDLDRCSDEKVVDILQAINLILGRSSFYVFLGMDTDMIYRAIDARYKVEEGKGQTDFSESYLRKIVQLSFHLPTTEADNRFSLVRRMFSPTARQAVGGSVSGGDRRSRGGAIDHESPIESGVSEEYRYANNVQIAATSLSVTRRRSFQGPPPVFLVDDEPPTGLGDIYRFDRSTLLSPRVAVLKEVEDTEDELRAFREFTQFMSPNPREIKRLVNVHRLVRILLVRPEAPLTKPEQRKLVAWLIFSSRWRDLVDDILRIAKDENQGDCMMALAAGQADPTVRQELEAFTRQLGSDGAISADDLRPGRLLPKAALISQMVRDIPAEPPQASIAPDPPTTTSIERGIPPASQAEGTPAGGA